jgi:5-methylcytosine-specific restriction endonuclease McrA
MRKLRKKQLRINGQIKKRLFGHLILAPCFYCKKVFLVDQLTIEHLLPLTLGGTNVDNNIALACAPCNHEKGRETWFLKKKLGKEKYQHLQKD